MSAPRPTGDDVLKLVEEAAAVEREACARIADDFAIRWMPTGSALVSTIHYAKIETAQAIAAQIRARGQK